MNFATSATLAVVILVVGWALVRTVQMIRRNDMCAFCDHPCGRCGNPINCTICEEK